MRHGEKSIQRKFPETVIHKCGDDFTHDAAAPKFLAEPIAELSRVLMHVLSRSEADSTNCRAVHLDTKILSRQAGDRTLQKIFRVFDCVRMRKRITQTKPHLAIY